MNELFSVDAVTKVHVSRLEGGYGLSIGSTYVVLSESEADRLARHFLFDNEKEVDTPPEQPVDSTTEGENGEGNTGSDTSGVVGV